MKKEWFCNIQFCWWQELRWDCNEASLRDWLGLGGGHSTSKSLDSNHGPSGKCNQLAHSSSITNNITCRGGGESWELFSIQQSEDSGPSGHIPFLFRWVGMFQDTKQTGFPLMKVSSESVERSIETNGQDFEEMSSTKVGLKYQSSFSKLPLPILFRFSHYFTWYSNKVIFQLSYNAYP